jgi:hypothetical protein
MDLSVRCVARRHQHLAYRPRLALLVLTTNRFCLPYAALLTDPSCRPQVNTIISRVTGRDRAKFEAKFAKKSKAEDAYHEKKEYVQEL